MKALVTGATGIVGSNLVRALLAASYQVRVLVRPMSDTRSLRGLVVEFFEGDVLEPSDLAAASAGCSIVFHAAATFAYWGQAAANQRDLAERGTVNVLRAARLSDIQRVVVTSSSVVLGSRATKAILDETDEFEEPAPSAYVLSKVKQERVAFEFGAELGLEVIAVCPTLAIGPYDYRLSPSNAYIINYLNDPFRSTFVGGCNIVSARDVAVGHVVAAERGRAGSRYVVGSENLTWQEVHALISALTGTFGPSVVLNHTASYLAALAVEVSARLTGTRPSVTREEARMSGRFYWYSHEQIAKLGYSPMPARQAMIEAIAWLLRRAYVTDSVMDKLNLSSEILSAQASFAEGVRT